MPEAALTTARRGHSVAIIGDWVYVIGGVDAEQRTLDTVERARIRADGTLDRFAPVPGVVLTTVRRGHSNAVVGGWLYVIGGENGPLGSVERAEIGAGGELDPFSVAPITLSVARRAHGTAVLGNFLYVLGGQSVIR